MMKNTMTHTGTVVDDKSMKKTDTMAPKNDDKSMKKTDTMAPKNDDKSMMSDKKKMMDDKMTMKDLSKMSVAGLAVHCGYNWKKDRAMFAEKAGIKKYTGTIKQNLIIKKYLLDIAKTMGTK